MKGTVGCLSAIVIAILMLIFWPVISYFTGYIAGMMIEWLIGDAVINGMNYIFNTTRFTTDMLPITCGTLNVIGSFFRSTSTSSSSK